MAPRLSSATLTLHRARVLSSVAPAARGGMPWWIAPLIAAAGVGGVGIQLLLTYLWVIAKGNLH